MLDKTVHAKRILHLSDLHFGRINEPALEALRQTVSGREKGLDLIVVTGDWTQRARSHEFSAAVEFVKTLSCPVLSVPGNHDVPLYDLGRRFFAPYSRYAKIRPFVRDEFHDELVSIVGLSTVNPFRVMDGVLREEDLGRVAASFRAGASTALRVVACHHPLLDLRNEEWIRPESRARRLMDLGPDVILSGHSHSPWVQISQVGGRAVVHISAGTSVSSRLREEVNSFHILELTRAKIKGESKAGSRGLELVVSTYDLREAGFLERGLPTEIFRF